MSIIFLRHSLDTGSRRLLFLKILFTLHDLRLPLMSEPLGGDSTLAGNVSYMVTVGGSRLPRHHNV